LSATDGSYAFLHFMRTGRWTVPLWRTAAVASDETASWEVRLLDYWGMKVTVLASLPGDANSAVIDVPALPANYEIALV
jgi:hypothetical protein